MKALLLAAAGLLLTSSSAMAAGCITTPRGQVVCRDASGAIVAPSAQSTTVVAPKPVVVAPSATVVGAPAAAVAPAYREGVTTVRGANGGAAYNPNTGNAAVSTRNANGVTTTQTLRGGEAKTKNGMGVVHGPNGTTCARGRGTGKCN